MVKALILRSAGINCNDETEQGFRMAGAETEQVHVNELISGKKQLNDYDVLCLPGGFSYGDYIAGGAILANQINTKLKKQLEEFVAAGKTVVGICNGFQVLVKTGLLPGDGMKATLTSNYSGKFECRWVKLIGKDYGMEAPVAHGEGKFVADKETLKKLEDNNQIIFRYSSHHYPANPNGSLNDIAGISNKQGNVIGLMPHPERNLTHGNHPTWTRWTSKKGGEADGMKFFRNIVERMK